MGGGGATAITTGGLEAGGGEGGPEPGGGTDKKEHVGKWPGRWTKGGRTKGGGTGRCMPTWPPAPGRPPGEPVRGCWAKAAPETSTRLAAVLRTTAETITCLFTSDLPRGSLRGKHFLEQGRRPRRRIRPDLPLLLAHHVEETVQRLADHVA